MVVDVRLLGPVEWLNAGVTMEIPGTSARAVLAMLALRAGEVVFTSELVDGLWDRSLPADPTAALHVTISRLRRAVGDQRDRLRRVPRGYVLDVDPAEVDVARVEHALAESRVLMARGDAASAANLLLDALGEWRHDWPLAEFADLPFASTAATRLHLLRAEVLEAANDADLQCGRPATVIDRTTRAVRSDPSREHLVGQLMTALYQVGRQAEALAAYAELASLLRADFGAEPSPDLQELRERVLAHAPGLGRASAATDAGAVLALPRWFEAALEDLAADGADPTVRGRLLLALGAAEHHAGLPGWQETLLQAGQLARQAGDTSAVARCALGGALGWSVSPGRPDRRRLELVSFALERSDVLDEGERVRLLGAYADELAFTADLAERIRVSDEAVALARASGRPALLLHALNHRFNAVWAPETLDSRQRDVDEALRVAEAVADPRTMVVAEGWAMAASMEVADIEGVDHHLARFEALATAGGSPPFLWGTRVHQCWRLAIAGETAPAEEAAEDALAYGRANSRPEAEVVYLGQRAYLA